VVKYLHVFMTALVVILTFVFGVMVSKMKSEVPGRSQNLFEMLVGGIEKMALDVMGEEGRPYIPLILP